VVGHDLRSYRQRVISEMKYRHTLDSYCETFFTAVLCGREGSLETIRGPRSKQKTVEMRKLV
jgi:hypothetical protein